MLSFAIITVLLDFILLFLPMPIVWTMQLPLKQRLAVCGLFFLGFIVCIAGIVQVYYIDVALVSSFDETWDGWPLWVASAIEVDIGVVSDPFLLQELPSAKICTLLTEPITDLRINPRHPSPPRHLLPQTIRIFPEASQRAK